MAEYQGTEHFFVTMGRRPPFCMGAAERLVKKRLGNPELWRQLETVSRGTYVNHLGRGHARDHPEYTEVEWQRRVEAGNNPCLACDYGNTAVYLHNHPID